MNHLPMGRACCEQVIGSSAVATLNATIVGIRIAALSAAVVGISVLDLGFALGAKTGGPSERSALARSQEGKMIVRVAGASPMSRCLATWDRSSGMSKKEWKATCR